MSLAPAPPRTRTSPDHAVLDVRVHPGPRIWTAGLGGTAPAYGSAVRIGALLRVAVLELPGRADLPPGDLRGALDRSRTGCAGQAADALAALAVPGRRPSIAVADLSPDGALTLSLRDAPPAIVLSCDCPARTVAAAGDTSLHPNDALLLCSATLLEDPPAALARVRGSTPGPGAVEELQRALALTGHPGATALVRCRPVPLTPATV